MPIAVPARQVSDLALADPSSVLTFAHDWTDWLDSSAGSPSDTISTHAWTITPDESPSLLSNADAAAVTVSGLTAGNVYRLTERVTTASGLTDERTIVVRCDER